MLEEVLLHDSGGRPIRVSDKAASQDWDEVQDFCRRVYMPYRVTPLGRHLKPDATMRQTQLGRITMSRFSYGVPIHLDDFDPAAGNILVLNTLRGALRHKGHHDDATTGPSESFIADCSRTSYWLDADAAHMQLNLTIPHELMAVTAERWFGFVPDDRLWTRRLAFGGRGSRWQSLLTYAAQSVQSDGRVSDPAAQHLQELICLDLLQIWAEGAGVSLKDGARAAAPHYVRKAEAILEARAQEAPSIGDVARELGISARTLSDGFQRFRGTTPREFLRCRRLDGLHAALHQAGSGQTVTSIASDWGYTNFGALAQSYRRRFGELPSKTLARAQER